MKLFVCAIAHQPLEVRCYLHVALQSSTLRAVCRVPCAVCRVPCAVCLYFLSASFSVAKYVSSSLSIGSEWKKFEILREHAAYSHLHSILRRQAA